MVTFYNIAYIFHNIYIHFHNITYIYYINTFTGTAMPATEEAPVEVEDVEEVTEGMENTLIYTLFYHLTIKS